MHSGPTRVGDQPPPAASLALLLAAPHRLLFFGALLGLVAASLWWAWEVLGRYVGLWTMPVPALPGLFGHAGAMIYGVMPAFMGGFLYTAGPRWVGAPAVSRPVFLATFLALAAGLAAWLAGQGLGLPWLAAGALLMALGWALMAGTLFTLLLRGQQAVLHGWVIAVALSVGCLGALVLAAGVVRGDGMLSHFAVRLGLWGALAPVFFAVSHRMLPFFAQAAVPGYQPVRPTVVLLGVVGLLYARIAFGVAGWLHALPVVDLALCLATLWLGLRWRPLSARAIPLLWTLFLAYFWLPVALGLQAARDLLFLLQGEWLLGRAPIHALGMGFMAGLVLSMVSRVSLGHSGRQLALSRLGLGCFLLVQVATVARVASELVPGLQAWRGLLLASVVLWLAGTLIWTGSTLPLYLKPRADGRPG